MTFNDHFEPDDLLSNALKGLDRPVEIRTTEIADYLAEKRKRSKLARKTVLAGAGMIGLGVVLGMMVASWPKSSDSKTEALAKSKPIEKIDSARGPTNRFTSIATAEPPVMETSNAEVLRSLEAERDRLRREVAELSVLQLKQARRQMRNAASMTLDESTRFVNAF